MFEEIHTRLNNITSTYEATSTLFLHGTVLNSNDLEPKKASCFTFSCVSFFSSACYCDELMMGSSSVKHTRQIDRTSVPKLQP